LTSVDTIKL
jgi:hypothetical protein